MSWLYSQALVEEYLGENFLDGEQFVQSSGNLTQQAYCAPDKMTAFSRLSRFGMTYKPLTENLGEELLTSYREGFHAKTSAQLEKGQELMESEVECGEKWHGLLARFDQDSHLWRTVQCSLLEDLNESLQTLPQWGMTVGGELYLLPTLVQTTSEKESGLWLTPSTIDIPTRSKESMEKRLEYRKKIGRNGVGAGCLSEQVEWSKNGPPIGYITKETWPTPRCQMTRQVKIRTDIEKGHKGNLEEMVALREKFPTPTAHNSKESNSPSEALRNEPTLAHRAGGKLNPMWVEWLMGWPIGWTDLKPLEMDKSHYVQQQLGES